MAENTYEEVIQDPMASFWALIYDKFPDKRDTLVESIAKSHEACYFSGACVNNKLFREYGGKFLIGITGDSKWGKAAERNWPEDRIRLFGIRKFPSEDRQLYLFDISKLNEVKRRKWSDEELNIIEDYCESLKILKRENRQRMKRLQLLLFEEN